MSSFNLARRLAEPAQAPHFSFDFFLPDSDQGILDLRARVERLAATDPLFIDIESPGDVDSIRRALQECAHAKRVAGLTTMFHVGREALAKAELIELLQAARAAGIINVLVERSDSPPAGSNAPWPHVAETVRLIRSEFGDAFCIAVLGFPPSGRGECGEYERDLAQLRAKQDAGADVVLAQHVVDARDFDRFRRDAAASGIVLPMVASVLPVHTPANFRRINALCGIALPPTLDADLRDLEGDRARLEKYAVRLSGQLSRDLLGLGAAALHVLTMNLEDAALALLADLCLAGPTAAARRVLPWRPSGDEGRVGESVRPIHWSNHPASYLERTAGWDAYAGPWTGRGSTRVYQPPLLAHLIPPWAGTPEERRTMWGCAPVTQHDVWAVFAGFIEGRVPRLPWSPAALLPETRAISTRLADLNRAGFLTINSQPRLNAARSDDPVFGWGGPGGYVYQKAYVEAFVPPGHVAALMSACSRRASVTYHAVDARGNTYSSSSARGVHAVTWGVFPGREVVQPTVVDPDAFVAWKSEAFVRGVGTGECVWGARRTPMCAASGAVAAACTAAPPHTPVRQALWLSQWASIYEEDSSPNCLIHDIHDSYFLVSCSHGLKAARPLHSAAPRALAGECG